MNSTSQNPGRKFPFGSGHNVMDNKTLYTTLVVSAGLALSVILLEYYAVHGRNPFNRVGYALFMSVLPAVVALVVLKLTRLFVSWRGAVLIYVVLFAAFVITQAVLRTI